MLSFIQRQIIEFLLWVYIANRAIIQDEFFPDDKDGSATRDVLRRMTSARLIDRVEIKPNDFVTNCCPVYMPNETGCAILAAETGNMKCLLNGTPPKRRYQDFNHYMAVTRMLCRYRKGFATQSPVRLLRLVLEHQWVNPEAEPAARRKLLTPLGRGKSGGTVVCAPDLADEIALGDNVRVNFWEKEMGSDTPSRVASKKSPGYFQFHQRGCWRELFPRAQIMRVIAVCPNAGWREALRRALQDKPGKQLWLCVSIEDIRRDGAFLTQEKVFFPVEGEPRSLVRLPSPPPVPGEGIGDSAVAAIVDASSCPVKS